MIIKVERPGAGKTMELLGDRKDRFVLELKRTSRYQSKDVPPTPLIGPDLIIRVINPSGTRVFHLEGRTVLRDVRTGRLRQFYLGLLMLEWMR